MTYYLYIKTHTKTGLQYLGQTAKEDYHLYTGSGKHWKRHIRVHGYDDVTTQIVAKCESIEDLQVCGLFFSKLFDVVKSKDWANLKEEKGSGGTYKFTPEQKKRMKENWTPKLRQQKSAERKKYFSDPEIREQNKLSQIEAQNRPDVIEKKRRATRLSHSRPETKAKLLFANHKENNPQYGKIWITNGSERKMIYPDVFHLWESKGYWKGRFY